MSDATKYRQWLVPRAVLDDLFKEKDMDAKANPATPLFKEEHVGKTVTVKPKATSSERAKFVELAQKRMNRAMKDIRQLGKLDRHAGWYLADDVKRMVATLVDELGHAEKRLLRAMQGEPDFQLGAQHDEGTE